MVDWGADKSLQTQIDTGGTNSAYTLAAVEDDDSFDQTVTYKVTGPAVPQHYNAQPSLGYWFGIGVPYADADYDFAAGFGTKTFAQAQTLTYKSGNDVIDGTFTDNGTTYLTFYYENARAQESYGGEFYLAVQKTADASNADKGVVAVYTIDVSSLSNAAWSATGSTGAKKLDTSVASLANDELNGTTIYFDDLQSAFASAAGSTNAVVSLVKSVDLSADTSANAIKVQDASNANNGVTFNLAGNTLTFGSNDSLTFGVGEATVNGSGTIVTAAEDAVTVTGTGTKVAFNNVTFSTATTAKALKVAGKAEVTATGSSFNASMPATTGGSTAGTAVVAVDDAKFTMPSGSITAGVAGEAGGYAGISGTTGAVIELGDKVAKTGPSINTYYAAIDATSATVNVYGGTYTNVNSAATAAAATAQCAAVNVNSAGDVTIEGGTITGKYYAALTANAAGSKLTVNGGEFGYGTDGGAVFYLNANSTVAVNGGMFGSATATAIDAGGKTQFIYGGKYYAKPNLTGASPVQVAAGCTYDATPATGPYTVYKNMADAVLAATATFTGSPVTPTTSIKWPNGTATTMEEGTDYTVLYYTDSTCSGTGVSQITQGTYYAKATPVDTSVWTGSTPAAAVTWKKASIADADVYLSSDGTNWVEASKYEASYTGQQVTPKVQVRFGDSGIVIPQAANNNSEYNYKVTYGTNVASGDATVTVTASATSDVFESDTTNPVTFTIVGTGKIDAAAFAVTHTPVKFKDATTADGQSITLPSVTSGTTTLALGTDYTISYTNPDGTAGNEIATGTSVTLNGMAGDYTFTVAGKGAYSPTDTKTVVYTIDPLAIDTATNLAALTVGGFTDNVATYVYGGVTPSVTGTITDTAAYAGGAINIQATDLDVTPAKINKSGSVALTVKGKGNFTGTRTLNVTVNPLNLSAAAGSSDAAAPYTMTLSGSNTFTGKAVTPTVTITDSATSAHTLTEGVDYQMSYYVKGDATKAPVTPTNVGTYVAVATGINGYAASGSILEKDWTVNGVDIDGTTATIAYNATKVGDEYTQFAFTGADYDMTQLVSLKKGATELVYGTDYTIVPEKISRAGKVTVYGAGNYGGTTKVLDIEFTEAVLSEVASVTAVPTDLVFKPKADGTGEALTPKFTVTNAETQAALVADTDYRVTAIWKSDDATKTSVGTTVKDAGTYTAKIEGRGNYASGDTAVVGADAFLTAEFTVAAFDLSKFEFPKTGVYFAGDTSTEGTYAFAGETVYPKPETAAGVLTVGYDKNADGDALDAGEQIALVQHDYAASGAAAVKMFTTTGYTDAGEYALAIVGEGNYAGTLANDLKFKVAKVDPAAVNTDGTTPMKVQFQLAEGVWADSFTGAVNSEPTVRVIYVTSDADAPYVFDSKSYAVKYGDGKQTVGNNGTVTVTFSGDKNASDGVLKHYVSSAQKDTWSYAISGNTLANAELKLAASSKDYAAGGYSQDAIVTGIVDKTSLASIPNAVYLYKKAGDAEFASLATATLEDPGTYTIMGYCTSGYSGSVTAEFTINALDISKQTIKYVDANGDTQTYAASADIEFPYTGEAIDLGITVDGLTKSTNGKTGDYTVAYEANTEVGIATATVAGINNYGGSVEIPFTIAKADFDDQFYIYKVDGVETSYGRAAQNFQYTGSPIEPKVVVADHGMTRQLTEGVDYELTYANNVGVASKYDTSAPKVIAVPISENYTGNASAAFAITAVDIASDKNDVKVDVAEAQYTGEGLTPKLTVTYTAEDGTVNELVQGIDYANPLYSNNVEVGTGAQYSIVGIGNYTGTLKGNFEIKQADLSKAKVTLATTSYTYNGKAKKPAVKSVKLNGVDVPAEAYTVAYSANVNASAKAKVTLTAANDNYTGKVTKTFTIKQAKNTAFKVTSKAKTAKKAKTIKKGKALAASKYLTVKKSKGGKVTYKLAKKVASGKVTVNSAGKITVNKKCKAGTYKLLVTATEKSTNYKTKTIKNVAVYVKVK